MSAVRRFIRQVRAPRDLDTYGIGLVAIASAIIAILASSKSMAISQDSLIYSSTAENIAHGRGIIVSSSGQLNNFPPGYPIFLGVLIWFGWSASGAAQIIAIISSFSTVLFTGLIGRRLGPRGSGTVCAALVACSPVFIDINSQLLSESLFTAGLMAVALCAVSLPREVEAVSWKHIGALTAGLWLVCTVRFVGYASVGAVLVLLVLRHGSIRRRAVMLAKFAPFIVSAPIFVVAQSLIRTGKAGAPVSPPESTFSGDIVSARHILGGMAHSTFGLPDWIGGQRLFWILLAIALIGIFLSQLPQGDRPWSTPSRLSGVGLFAVSFLAVVLISARRVWVEVSQRMLSPLLPLLVIVFVISLVILIRRIDARFESVALVVGCLFVVLATLDVPSNIRSARAWTDDIFQKNYVSKPLAEAVSDLPSDAILLSNGHSGMYFVTGRNPLYQVDWLRDDEYFENNEFDRSKVWTPSQDMFCSGFYIAWNAVGLAASAMPPRDDIDERISAVEPSQLDEIARFDDGVLYFVQGLDRNKCNES